MQTEDVLFDVQKGTAGNLGIITLNRPQALNALNLPMFLAMDKQLAAWEADDSIKAVVVRAEGRAFCAGGDIRAVYEAKQRNELRLSDFFADEYRLDSRIYHFTKPYIALMDGIAMGGGVGISINASHRVATEKFIFAMPETAIGFYPDVSATYFLPRLQGKIGFYLGLTGERLDYSNAFELGIVNHIANKDSFPEIITAIAEAPLGDYPKKTITDILKKFDIVPPRGTILEKRTVIDTCFSKSTVEDILEALTRYPDPWAATIASGMRGKSPTSLKVTLRQLQLGESMDFDACMKLELQLTSHFIEEHDFFEGIRAAVIDKDKKPQWKPAKLEEVSEEDVDKYFQAVTQKFS